MSLATAFFFALMLPQSCKKTTQKRDKWWSQRNGSYLVITFYLEFKWWCWPVSLSPNLFKTRQNCWKQRGLLMSRSLPSSRNKNSPLFLSRAQVCIFGGLPAPWSGGVDIRREEPAPAQSHRSWTSGGREWLRAERMSQASCAELALNSLSVLNGLAQSHVLLWSKWATFC